MEASSPGCPDPEVVNNPVACPSNPFVKFVIGRSSNFSLLIVEADPVKELFSGTVSDNHYFVKHLIVPLQYYIYFWLDSNFLRLHPHEGNNQSLCRT